MPLVRLMPVAVLAADEASSAALLAMGIATEAQTANELVDNERDERARMTSVERAAKVVEHDRKRTERRRRKKLNARPRWLSVIVNAQKRRRRRKLNVRPRWLSVIVNAMPNGLQRTMQRL